RRAAVHGQADDRALVRRSGLRREGGRAAGAAPAHRAGDQGPRGDRHRRLERVADRAVMEAAMQIGSGAPRAARGLDEGVAYGVPRAGERIELALDGNEGAPPDAQLLREVLASGVEGLRRYPDA